MSPSTSIHTESRMGYVPHEFGAQLLGARLAPYRP